MIDIYYVTIHTYNNTFENYYAYYGILIYVIAIILTLFCILLLNNMVY